jgi:predicted membrane protein
MRLVVALALVVIVGLIAGGMIGDIVGARAYRGSIPGAIVAVSVFAWRRREEGGSLKAIKIVAGRR